MSEPTASMHCPTCEEQTLETLRFPQGTLERCTNCLYFLVEQKALAALSDDRSQFLSLMEETKGLLLPSARFCPRCYQKFHHGRVKSRQLILTLCPSCQSVWIDFPTLNQLSESLERNLKAALEYGAAPPPVKKSDKDKDAPAPKTPAAKRKPITDPSQDKGLARLFRGTAFLFDRWADRFGGHRSTPKPAPAAVVKPPSAATPLAHPVEAVKEVTVEKKPKLEPVLPPPAPVVEPPKPPPVIESKPEAVLAPIPELKPELKPEPELVPILEPEIAPEPEPIPEVLESPRLEVSPFPSLMESLEEKPAAPPLPEKAPEPVGSKAASEDEVRKMLLEQTAPKPKKSSIPQLPQPVAAKKSGFAARVANFFKPSKTRVKPAPAKLVTPLLKPTPAPEPTPPVVAAEIPVVPVAPSVPEPKPEPLPISVEIPKPPPIPEPVPIPEVIQAPEPILEPSPMIPETPVVLAKPPKSEPVIKKPKEPKVKKPRAPMMDLVAAWLPRVLPIIAFLLNLSKGPDFDFGMAIVWSLMAWAGGTMLRLWRMYPFKPFVEASLETLGQRPGLSRWQGIPVIIKGHLLDEKPVILADASGQVALNRLSKLDILPRFLGVSNFARMATEDVTVKGWYRGGANPFIEIGEIQAGKTHRKSLVRGLRWTGAILLVVISLLILLSD